jgi:hypothetical protein
VDDLPGIQAGGLLGELVIFLDGLIANGKFCCVRRVQLSLAWWPRPLETCAAEPGLVASAA